LASAGVVALDTAAVAEMTSRTATDRSERDMVAVVRGTPRVAVAGAVAAARCHHETAHADLMM